MMAADRPTGRKRGGPAANTKPANGLTRRGRSHSEATRTARKAAEIATRSRKAWDLFTRDELTFEQIGKRLGVSNYTAHQDVMRVKNHLLDGGALDPDLLRTKQQARLTRIARLHNKKAGTKTGADVLIRVSEREARLNGLDRQRETGYTLDQMLGLLRGIRALFLDLVTDDGVRQAFARGLTGKVGPALMKAIDVTPERKADDEEKA